MPAMRVGAFKVVVFQKFDSMNFLMDGKMKGFILSCKPAAENGDQVRQTLKSNIMRKIPFG